MERHGIEPSPERIQKTTWKEFLRQLWDLVVAADFFTIEVWTRKELQRFLVLFFLELSTRRVEIAGMSTVANGLWMSQIARNLTDSVDGLLTGNRYLIHDPIHCLRTSSWALYTLLVCNPSSCHREVRI